MDKLYITMPAYNEEGNIEHGKRYLVIIGIGSKDDTYRIMREYKDTLPNFIPLTKANSGHGSTTLY